MKKAGLVIGTMLMVTALAACGGNNDAKPGNTTTNGGQAESRAEVSSGGAGKSESSEIDEMVKKLQNGKPQDEECFSYTKESDGIHINWCSLGDNNKDGLIIIPEKIEGIDVVAINKNSIHHSDVKGIRVPGTVKEIGESIFYGSGIQVCVLDEGVENIGIQAFELSDLEKIIIPKSVKKIGTQAFALCENLKEIYIPESVKDFYMGVFMADEITVITPAGSDADKECRRWLDYIKEEEERKDYSAASEAREAFNVTIINKQL